jgi:hypothetical protein
MEPAYDALACLDLAFNESAQLLMKPAAGLRLGPVIQASWENGLAKKMAPKTTANDQKPLQ